MKFLQKLLFVLVLLCAAFVFSKEVWAGPYEDCIARGNTPSECRAASGTWFVQPPEVWNQKVFQSPPGEMFKERFVFSILGDMMNSIITIGRGTSILVQGPGGPVYTHSGGIFSLMIDMATTMTAGPPISPVEYIAYVGSNLGIAKPVYAQGLGFASFSPLLTLWKISRDITYLGFVVIFIIVGFMIMFRKKIDPRTVVTIQDSLPRIVVALILVTFSYAIAGFIVDAGELTTRLIGNTLADNHLIALKTGVVAKDTVKFENLLRANSFSLTETMRNPGKFADALWEGTLQQAFGTTDVPGPIKWILSVPTQVILIIAGIFIAFKIFFSLLSPYATIVLYVIFAPFILMLSALPGMEFSLGSWLKDLVSRVLVFPVVFTLLAISAILYGVPGGIWSVQEKSWGTLWQPVVMGGLPVDAVGPLIAFGILFAIPHVAEAVQQAFQIKPGPLAQAGELGLKGLPIIGRLAK